MIIHVRVKWNYNKLYIIGMPLFDWLMYLLTSRKYLLKLVIFAVDFFKSAYSTFLSKISPRILFQVPVTYPSVGSVKRLFTKNRFYSSFYICILYSIQHPVTAFLYVKSLKMPFWSFEEKNWALGKFGQLFKNPKSKICLWNFAYNLA